MFANGNKAFFSIPDLPSVSRTKFLITHVHKAFFSIPDLPTVSRTKFLKTHVQVEAVQRLLHRSYSDLLHSESKALSRRRVEC